MSHLYANYTQNFGARKGIGLKIRRFALFESICKVSAEKFLASRENAGKGGFSAEEGQACASSLGHS
jgi:hypothetical protein